MTTRQSTSRGSALAGRHAVAVAPLQTLAAAPRRAKHAERGSGIRVKVTVVLVLVVAVLSLSFGAGGLVQQQRARATGILTFETFSITSYLNRLLDELDQITVDQIRKIVIKEITKKVIEKVIYGENGGTGIGGALGTSGHGASAFINDYAAYLYLASAEDTNRFVDAAFDKYFPSYIDPRVKQYVRQRFDPNHNFIASDCVDSKSIDFANDPEALKKMEQALQPGCNDLSAAALLLSMAQAKYSMYAQASQTEAVANKGVLSKDEKTNKLKQSGVVYEAIVQGAIEAVYNVQTESQSAVSQIVGALVDQVIDEILSNTTND